MKLDVLLTDGHYKHTYAILRALAAHGLKVGILFHNRLSLSYYSKLVTKRFLVSPDIYQNELIYRSEIIRILKSHQIDILMPIGNISNFIASKYKNTLNKYTEVPVVDFDIMRTAQFKNETFKFAEKIGVPIPSTTILKPGDDIAMIAEKESYPCVIKKVNPHETGIIYCNNRSELKDHLEKSLKSWTEGLEYPIIQEYVEGKGTGYFALFDHGKCVAYFMHKRVHEYPITGGPSTLAKSINDNTLKELGERLLTRLKWHGVAMVEFKRNLNGDYKLMEINPKFWGSLELSYKAGINFPYLLYRMAKGWPIQNENYKKNIYFRWTIPHDFLWWLASSKRDRQQFGELKRNEKIFTNIHFDDPLIILFNSCLTFYKFFTETRFPHGKVQKSL